MTKGATLATCIGGGVIIGLVGTLIGLKLIEKPTNLMKAANPNPIVAISTDPNSSPPSCYSDNAWPGLPANNTSASVDWASSDNQTYYVIIAPNLLIDRGGNPVTTPIKVTSAGTSGGAYKLSSGAVRGCTGSGPTPSSCYISYDISLDPSGRPSCVQHYPTGGPGYDTGIHIDR